MQVIGEKAWASVAEGHAFSLGLPAVDALLPGGFGRGAVHEVLVPQGMGRARLFGLLIARAAAGKKGAIIWNEGDGRLYPPAVAAMGVELERLYLVRPRNAAEEHWVVAECLRCKGVGAVVALPERISHVEARRLQLAAEAGGGVGVLLREENKWSSVYAAATRWRVRPARGERTVQRWRVELIHGHGGRAGEGVYLESCRESHLVRAVEKLADRPVEAGAEAAGVG